jgi:hypothetical protein
MTRALPEHCPACGAPRGAAREYCLECGTRLTAAHPPPVHWLWASLAALLIAAGGGAAAAAVSNSNGTKETIVATQRLVSVPATPATSAGTAKNPKPPTPTGSSTLIPWPGSGYTLVLATIPTSRGAVVAKRRALAAVAAGLRDVGVLVSASYPGLHPGYFIVFSGIYSTLAEAQSALPGARPAFPGAYARLVAK